MTEEGDQVEDNFSDDDEVFDATARVSSTRRRRTSLTSANVDVDVGIMRAYSNIPSEDFKLIIYDDSVAMPSFIVGPTRAYPVFIGLLSLAAAKDCRILEASDLDHPRSCQLLTNPNY